MTLDAPTLDRKYHFLLRKLHSLSGIVPVGVFLIEHLLTNSMAFQGPAKFNEDVHWIHNLPYLFFLELFGIFLPLAFHAGYGIVIAMTAEPNVSHYPYLGNVRYTLQRLTGYIAFVFIIVHLFKFRFAHIIGWGPEFIHEGNNYHEITRRGLMDWQPFGYHVPWGVTMSIYVIGLMASIFHFCNGIWSFCISWGIAVGVTAQRRIGYAATALGLLLMTWGGMSLYAFKKAPAGASIKAGESSVAVAEKQ